MISLRIFINMMCVAALAIGLYLVKYSVADVQREVATLKVDLAAEKESLHLLNAEWAYLNRPDRLRQLADRHLDLVPLESRQINQVSALPAAATVRESRRDSLLHPASSLEEVR